MIEQTFYITYSALEEIFLFPEHYPELYKILDEYSNVMVDLHQDEFNDRLETDMFLKFLHKRVDCKTDCLRAFFDDILDFDLDNNAKDWFVLDLPVEDCADAREHFGVAVFSKEELNNIIPSPKQAKWHLRKNERYNIANTKLGWEAIVSSIKLAPINSLVLVDNYLFDKDREQGMNNALSLFKGIMPRKLGVPFNILIVIAEKVAYSAATLETTAKNISERLSDMFTYTVTVGIITHNRPDVFHQRAVITNYHFFESHHGYNSFKTDGLVSFENNDLKYYWSFASVCDPVGQCEVRWMAEILRDTKDQVNTNSAHTLLMSTNILAGDCRNRLIN
ncbi:hypothetical protein GCM10027341_27140 [Spirosoma knui]